MPWRRIVWWRASSSTKSGRAVSFFGSHSTFTFVVCALKEPQPFTVSARGSFIVPAPSQPRGFHADRPLQTSGCEFRAFAGLHIIIPEHSSIWSTQPPSALLLQAADAERAQFMYHVWLN